jgi:hypothetical protein
MGGSMSSISIDWATLKTFITTYSLSLQWVDLGTVYYLRAYQDNFDVECSLPKDGGANQTDFETNYKSKGNLPTASLSSIQQSPPFGSKTISVNGVTKSLFARYTGVQYAVTAGANTLTYTATLTWAKMLGVECIGCEALDTVDFKVYDTAAGTYSGHANALLNQFSFAMNLPKDYYRKMSQFDADVYAGMVISMTYTSASNKNIGINFFFDEVK